MNILIQQYFERSNAREIFDYNTPQYRKHESDTCDVLEVFRICHEIRTAPHRVHDTLDKQAGADSIGTSITVRRCRYEC